jgi:hypothetical protein
MMTPSLDDEESAQGLERLVSPLERFVNGRRGLVVTLIGVALGAATGILEQFVFDETLIDAPSFAVLMTATLALAIHHRVKSTRREFFIEMFWGWIGYGIGWSLINLKVTPDLLFALLSFGLPVALVGWLILRPLSDAIDDAGDLSEMTAPQ